MYENVKHAKYFFTEIPPLGIYTKIVYKTHAKVFTQQKRMLVLNGEEGPTLRCLRLVTKLMAAQASSGLPQHSFVTTLVI
jgi:hypothetical protein